MVGGIAVRQDTVTAPSWNYDATERAADGAAGAFELRVSQISDQYGPGLAARTMVA